MLLGFAAQFVLEAQLQAVNRAAIAAVRGGDPQRLLAITRIVAEQARDDGARLAGMLNILFGPMVALLGSVIGFYFGSKKD